MRLFEFDADTRQHRGVTGNLQQLRDKLPREDLERLDEMYRLRRKYSTEQLARLTRPAQRFGDEGVTPYRKAGESRQDWLKVVKQHGHVAA